MNPESILAHSINQITLCRSKGEFASALQWENIQAAAQHLINLSERIAVKKES